MEVLICFLLICAGELNAAGGVESVGVWVGVIVSDCKLSYNITSVFFSGLASYGMSGERRLVQYWRALFWPPYAG